MQLRLNSSASASAAGSMLGEVSGDGSARAQVSAASSAMAEAESLARAKPVRVTDYIENPGEKARLDMQKIIIKDEVEALEATGVDIEKFGSGMLNMFGGK